MAYLSTFEISYHRESIIPNLYFHIIITVHITSTKIITCINPNTIFLLQSATNTKLALLLQYYNAHIAELENYKAIIISTK